MNRIDPSGKWSLAGWAEALISSICPMGWAFVGANKAYETSKSLDISGWFIYGAS